ncbi:glycerate kinase [Candidimonas humi]|uniref:Glycerate kinase n=1 Tax=Candidimonas humi TaxID=683355 RepID=A0ABV8NW73_9BURK|nr:glycerate kinase [Candidimonas humi]MBV6303474.1 glycerate kinase [Candidimonas humi]
MRIVIAPDSYKESLSAAEVARAIEAGVLDALPQAQTVCVPMADGGEGSLAAVAAATGAELRKAAVRDANGRDREAEWALLPDGSAFIEIAAAAGLEQIEPDQRNALRATSYGVGQLVLQALDAGARRITIGLGGSACNDGGAGMLQALGLRLLDAAGQDLGPGGSALRGLHVLAREGMDPRLAHTEFEVAMDVNNPLCGPQGASAVFGPQKGADAQQVEELDAALAHFADVCAAAMGRDERNTPGAGAAGGLGYAIRQFLDASFRPGAELVAELAGLPAALQGADLVFTGEGRMDAQTPHGKTPVGVARYAQRLGIPVFALAGSLGPGYEAVYAAGITAAFSLAPGPVTLEQACREAPHYLRQRAGDIVRAWRASAAS